MIKKLFSVVCVVLAINFLIAAGGAAFLAGTGKINKEKMLAIREIIAGESGDPTTQPATQPAQEPPPETPEMRLDAAVAKAAGRRSGNQLDATQISFDSQSAMLERRAREIEDQRNQLALAKSDFEQQLKKLQEREAVVKSSEQKQTALESDEGFQSTLDVYKKLPPKKTKQIFLTLDDVTVVRYLQAMDSGQASGILKEFKTPEENSRAQALLEKMRQAK